MDTNKQKYKKVCEENDSVPFFLHYNWYNTLFSENDWGVVVEEQNNKVVGFIPYYITKKMKFKVIVPPALTPYQGVWLNYNSEQKYTNRLSFEKKVMTSLINQLPKADAFKQKFYPEITNWLPFYWKGFSQTTRYTYVLDEISDLDSLFTEFRENIRREIRKAEKSLSIESLSSVDELYELKVKTYLEQKDNYPFSLSLLKKVFGYCLKYNCGELLAAKDKEGNIHSIILYVWDKHSAYYLHGATNSDFKTTGSMSLLLWEAIKRSSSKTTAFNFEGSMIEPIERYFRAFGGKQTPYFEVSKTSSQLLKLLNY